MLHYVGLFVLVKSQWLSSPTKQIFKGCFHSLLQVLKSKFHAQSESLNGEFEVLVCE